MKRQRQRSVKPPALPGRRWPFAVTAFGACLLVTALLGDWFSPAAERPVTPRVPERSVGGEWTSPMNAVTRDPVVSRAPTATRNEANQGVDAVVHALRDRLLRLLPGLAADGHATLELEALLVDLARAPINAAFKQRMLWETALGSTDSAARSLIYDMLESVGSDFIARQVVEHFDAVASDTERARVLKLLARGLEVHDDRLLEGARAGRLEQNTELTAELLGRVITAGPASAEAQRTALMLLPEVAPADLAMAMLADAHRAGGLDSAAFYDAMVRVVFAEPEQIALHATDLLHGLSQQPQAVRDSVNSKLYAFVAANGTELGPASETLVSYLQRQEVALLEQSASQSPGEWVALHHDLLKARASLQGSRLDLASARGLDVDARATLVNANPAALSKLSGSQLAHLVRDLEGGQYAAPAGSAREQSILDAAALAGEVLQSRAGIPVAGR